MALSPGTHLGRYEVISKIGEGGMGEVYRARDEKLKRDVAIKVLPAALCQDQDRLRRFEQEAQAAGTLNHPNILAVYDFGIHDAAPYVVSELLEGETLREVLHGGPVPTRKAIDYAIQIARGLAAAHEKGIIHRDLKPDNLFLTKDSQVKILDFGLAKLSQASLDANQQTDIATLKVQTDPGTVMGTVGYMSPEQVRARPVDHRSDIFSFGAVLYEMLAGRRAFRGDSAIETLNAILKEEPSELTSSNVNIAPALERVVWHCLEKTPDRRFQSASDVAFALESMTEVSSHPSQQSTTQLTTVRSPHGWTRERTIWIALCSVLALGTVTLAYLYLSRSQVKNSVVRLSLATPLKTEFPRFVTISPDGKRVVFVATNSDGKRLLYLRSFDSNSAEPLAATEDATAPFWSPDSRYIGYFANLKLFKIEASGGRPQALCDVTDYNGGTWNSDGVILLGGGDGLHRVSAQGGTPQLITKISAQEEAHRWPYFLPDGKRFVFLGDAATTENHRIRIGSLDSQETQVLFSAVSRIVYAPPGYLLYVNQGALVSVPFDVRSGKTSGEPVVVAEHIAESGQNHGFDFSVSNDGSLAYRSGDPNGQLTWLDRTGKKVEKVGEPFAADAIVLSPDGRTVALGQLDADGRQSDIWLFDLSRQTPSRLTFDPHSDGNPVWSPDSTRIIFSSNRLSAGIGVDLFEKSASGVGDEKLLAQTYNAKFPTSWSPDGRFLLFDDFGQNENANVGLLSIADQKTSLLLQSKSFSQFTAQFSPDGQFIAYVSDESGRPEVYVRRFPLSSERWKISSATGLEPLWGKNGKEMFFISEDSKLMVVEVKTGSSFESGVPHELFQIHMKTASGYAYAISPDGQRFLVSSPLEDESAALSIVLNWTSGLKQN